MSTFTRRESLVRLAGVAAAAAGVEAFRDAPSASAAIEQGVAPCILTR